MSKIVELVPLKNKTNAETIEILERWLLKARSGRIISVAIVGVHPDNSVVTESSETGTLISLVGALSLLQHRIIVECAETFKDDVEPIEPIEPTT